MGIFTTPRFEISGYEEPGDYKKANLPLGISAFY